MRSFPVRWRGILLYLIVASLFLLPYRRPGVTAPIRAVAPMTDARPCLAWLPGEMTPAHGAWTPEVGAGP